MFGPKNVNDSEKGMSSYFLISLACKSLLFADGYCNDENNKADCAYDGGDCCLSSPITDHCSQCACSTTGVITSPGYPGNYANNLDVSWHIQVPSGKLIEINFISFDIDIEFISCQ